MHAKRTRTAAIVLLLVSFHGQASAQENPKALSERATEELKLLVAFQTLERSATGMDRLLTYSIVSSTGGWKVFNFMEAGNYTNPFILKSLAEEMQIDAVRAKATIERSFVATGEDKKNAAAHVAELEKLICAARIL